LRVLPDLPISPFIPKIAQTLLESPSRFLILTAETGAGKSTVIPPGLLDYFPGKILMTEPRRIAALSIAERVSEILGENCGNTCGYKIHLENKTSQNTRIEIVTEAVLSRMLQADPSLEGYDLVILDEFHERSLTTDLNLAFLKEAMELRDNLFAVVMSATMETGTLAAYIGGDLPRGNDLPSGADLPRGNDLEIAQAGLPRGADLEIPQTGLPRGADLPRGNDLEIAQADLPCGNDLEIPQTGLPSGARLPGATTGSQVPVLNIPGRTFPVEVEYKPGLDMVKAVKEELSVTGQVILAFLPGIKEIRKAENELLESGVPAEVLVLHSSVSLSHQKKIFEPLPSGTNRVILSSGIAETSLTVPGVTTVIDSGLSRMNKLELALGMESLETVAESTFSAEQRKGRAGRTQEGRCVRLWNKNEPRQKSQLPEILRSDVSELVLECAAWGKVLSAEDGFFLDSPGAAAIKTSSDFLKNMKFLDGNGKITGRGRLALETGLSPRLSNLVVFAAENPSVTEEAVQLILKYSNYADAKGEMQKRFCDDVRNRINKIESDRLLNTLEKESNGKSSKHQLLFAGFSDRLAKKQEPSEKDKACGSGKIAYKFPNGHSAILAKDLAFSQAPDWLIAPEVLATASGGTIFNYEALSSAEAQSLIEKLLHTEVSCTFNQDRTKINKTERTMFGRIVLSEKKLPVSKDDQKLAWCSLIKAEGINALELSPQIENLLLRAQFYSDHKEVTDKKNLDKTASNTDHLPSPTVLQKLQDSPEEWLSPFLTDGRLTQETLYNALYWFLDGAVLDQLVPAQITLENGRRAKVVYEMNSSPDDKTKLVIRPAIEIIIQRIFGCMENPKIMGVPVLLKLLSPASRPLQITDDLAGFWNGTWIEICKEMKGRYPKHNWDFRIAEKD